jgi:hypothetical protein
MGGDLTIECYKTQTESKGFDKTELKQINY